MKKPMVKLNNGTSVPLSEFVTWSVHKQNMRTMPIEQKREIAEKISLKNSKGVITPKGVFSNMSEAVKALGISNPTLKSLCLNTAYPNYQIINPSARDLAKQFHKEHKAGSKKTITPIGSFDTMKSAAKALGISVDILRNYIKHDKKNYYYSKENLFVGVRKVHDPSDFHPALGYRLAKKVMTPAGMYRTRPQAARAFGLLTEEMKLLMKLNPEDFYFIK
jgi:hypothetical protein